MPLGGQGDPPTWPKKFVNKNAIKSENLTPPAPDPPPENFEQKAPKFFRFLPIFLSKNTNFW